MVNLGLFSMPIHSPDRVIADALSEDRELVILADKLGFQEAWMGEHFTSVGEPVTSPLIFNASLIDAAPNINFGTGVLCLPQQHPVVVAGHVALLDQLSKGRVLFGIGSGGLASDWEIFDNLDHEARGRSMLEAIDAIINLWTCSSPIKHDGDFWPFKLEKFLIPEIGLGQTIKPFQKPYPKIAVSLRGANSGLARLAGSRGWIPISGNFVPAETIATHWPTYEDEARKSGEDTSREIWRVGRSILITETQSQADDIINDLNGVFTDYYYYLNLHLKMVQGDIDKNYNPAIEREEARSIAKRQVSIGTATSVLDQLIAFYDIVGEFGYLNLTAHDISGNPDLWFSSMRVLAEEVVPSLSKHIKSKQQ